MGGEVVFGLAGILIAAAAQFVALMLAGAGHGWITPFWFSMSLWLLLPLVLIRFERRRAGKAGHPALDLGLFMVALSLDVALIIKSADEGADYFMKMVAVGPEVVALWILLWLSWQVGALFLLFRRT